jgi:uncharacterized protein (TIGR02266 family)
MGKEITAFEERRKHPRYPIPLMVKCATLQRAMQMRTGDISIGGVFLRTTTPEPVGTSVTLTMRLPGGLEVHGEGLVVHTRKGVGMGIQFRQFAGSGEHTLERFIADARDTHAGCPTAVRPGERRAHPRAQLHADVKLRSEGNLHTVFARDVSEGGVCVATGDMLALGSQVEIELSLPDEGPPIAVRGEVRWQRVRGTGPDLPAGMGVRFLNLAFADRRRIEAFVARRDTRFHDDE